ncbi:hypothetical protein DV515_00012649 [Chloebia gouldiae]|uniref:Uncharacterized protein n=1 Tax=Chloebia gouldiae TaxID=44316 RepID=A0A3L8S3Q8_CHLGU|nr:hypothetical protein DV515_00012649 [Chloebia gouldiae]
MLLINASFKSKTASQSKTASYDTYKTRILVNDFCVLARKSWATYEPLLLEAMGHRKQVKEKLKVAQSSGRATAFRSPLQNRSGFLLSSMVQSSFTDGKEKNLSTYLR